MTAIAATHRFALLLQAFPELSAAELTPASSDASFRRYFRVNRQPSRIVMDAPPAQEPLGPFLAVHARLAAADLHVPTIFAADTDQGFLLMEDLGHTDYLSQLTATTVDALYSAAFDALLQMQTRISTADLPPYDAATLHREMALFPTWCLQRHGGWTLTATQQRILDHSMARLVESALAQPPVFVHRDFHSRNLMVTPERSPGILDFQDAVAGPLTYDLVSLLRDCYVAWPDDQVTAWALQYRQMAQDAGLVVADAPRFLQQFDWMGLQRHLKVLGIFCRLYHRDGKARYLADLPLVLDYARRIAHRYPEFAELAALLDDVNVAVPLATASS